MWIAWCNCCGASNMKSHSSRPLPSCCPSSWTAIAVVEDPSRWLRLWKASWLQGKWDFILMTTFWPCNRRRGLRHHCPSWYNTTPFLDSPTVYHSWAFCAPSHWASTACPNSCTCSSSFASLKPLKRRRRSWMKRSILPRMNQASRFFKVFSPNPLDVQRCWTRSDGRDPFKKPTPRVFRVRQAVSSCSVRSARQGTQCPQLQLSPWLCTSCWSYVWLRHA